MSLHSHCSLWASALVFLEHRCWQVWASCRLSSDEGSCLFRPSLPPAPSGSPLCPPWVTCSLSSTFILSLPLAPSVQKQTQISPNTRVPSSTGQALPFWSEAQFLPFPSQTLPRRAVCISPPAPPRRPIILPNAGRLQTLSLCEHGSCKTRNNHIFLPLVLLATTFSLRQFAPLLSCYFSTFLDFFLLLVPHPLTSFDIGVSWAFVLIFLSLSFQMSYLFFWSQLYSTHAMDFQSCVSHLCPWARFLLLGLGQAQGKGLSTPSPSILTTACVGWAATTVPAFPTGANCGLGSSKNVHKVSRLIYLLDRPTWNSFRHL